MYRSRYSKEVTQKDYGKQVTVAGWIEDIRNLGSIAFVILRDGKGTLQITVLKKKIPELFEQLTSFSRESVISVWGLCKENEKVRNGYEILPEAYSSSRLNTEYNDTMVFNANLTVSITFNSSQWHNLTVVHTTLINSSYELNLTGVYDTEIRFTDN